VTEPSRAAAESRPRRVRSAHWPGRRSAVLAAIVFTLALLLPPIVPSPAAAQTADGFEDELVASVPQPTAIAFLPEPDGRMLVASKPGELFVLPRQRDTTVEPTPVLDLRGTICTDGERGLLGVAVDPNFSGTDNFVYLYYTVKSGQGCANQVARFRMTTGDTITGTPERLLLQNIPSPATNHNAGDVQFGRDGYLYVSIGDGANAALAPKRFIVNGKILRITKDGGIPPSNPYARLREGRRCNLTGRTRRTKICQEIFALGLRNPFRMAFDPDGTAFFINDVGAATWEEINVGRAGANYGWPAREGPCPTGRVRTCGRQPKGTTRPLHAYRHSSGCQSITGGAFVPNDANGWPAPFRNSYLYADFVCDTIFALSLDGARPVFWATKAVGSPIALEFGPAGDRANLYYASFNNGGEIRRIFYTGSTAADAATTEDARRGDASAQGSDLTAGDGGNRRQRQAGASPAVIATATATPTDQADDPTGSRDRR